MFALPKFLASSLSHIFFPHLCKGCNADLLQPDHQLCYQCLADLPFTDFADHSNNPVEKTFYGRIKLEAAMSLLYFTPSSITKELVHQFKYKGQKQLASYLGAILGKTLAGSSRFRDIDHILPLPLFRNRERQRGYNQSALLAEGIQRSTGIPVLTNALIRQKATRTQTHRSREERWLNVDGQFMIPNPSVLAHKSVLLVDDVITTGATLDACASVINTVPGTRLYISTLAFAMK